MRARDRLSGIFAALPTPVLGDGCADVNALSPLLDQLLGAGVAGVCVGGATGEYPCFEVVERMRIVGHISAYLAGRKPLICGIGSESWRQILDMAEVAHEAGAAAVLLPPPSFFQYRAADLKELFRQVALACRVPVLLYHIPKFTKGLQPPDLIDLVRSEENIVGIKDSSGERETLTQFSRAKQEREYVLFVGSDDLLLAGLELNADGAISGVCSVLPQLVLGLYHAFNNAESVRAADLQALLQSFVSASSDLPAAWPIKIALEAQGFPMGCSSCVAGPGLKDNIEKFRQWFVEWSSATRSRLLEPGTSPLPG
jgi:dihydrodipicolinate synthase/N-acetylneuraminate lyase